MKRMACYVGGVLLVAATALAGPAVPAATSTTCTFAPRPPSAAEWHVKHLGATAGRAPQLIYSARR
jgi:hypothetical protein